MCRAGSKAQGKRGLTPRSLVPQSPHFGGVPLFLTCWYWSFPPGVLTMRTLLERVLYLVVPDQQTCFEAWLAAGYGGLLLVDGLTDFSVAEY